MRWIKIPKRLLVYMLEVEIALELKGYGTLYHQYIANVLFVILIFGLHMMKSFLKRDTRP